MCIWQHCAWDCPRWFSFLWYRSTVTRDICLSMSPICFGLENRVIILKYPLAKCYAYKGYLINPCWITEWLLYSKCLKNSQVNRIIYLKWIRKNKQNSQITSEFYLWLIKLWKCRSNLIFTIWCNNEKATPLSAHFSLYYQLVKKLWFIIHMSKITEQI